VFISAQTIVMSLSA